MKEKARALYADTLFRNSFYLMLSTGVMAGFGFFFWLIAAHLYRPEEVGVASTLISAMIFISYVSLLGFNSTFVRFLPTSKNRSRQIDTGLILVGAAAILIGLGYALLAPRFASNLSILHQHWYFVVGFALLVMGFAVNLVTDSIFIAYRAAKYNLLVDGVIASSVQLAMPALLVGFSSFGLFAAQGIAASVAMVLSIIFLIRRFAYKPRLAIDAETVHEVRDYSLANYLANLLNIAPTMILPAIVLSRLGAASAGYYYLAFMMANLLFTIAYAVSQSLFAEGSYGDVKLRQLVKRSALILGAIMVPASLALALLGPFALKLFGEGYSDNARGLILALAATGPFMAAYVLGTVLLRIVKRNRLLIVANGLFALVTVGLAWRLAPKGLAWVGISWMIACALTALVIFIGLIPSMPKRADRKKGVA